MIKDRLQIARGSATRITSFLNSFRDYEIIFNTDTNRLGIVLPNKTIVYIGVLDINEHNTDTEATHLDIRQKVDEAKAIAEGKSRARVFATKNALDTWLLDSENVASLQIGDHFYIEETDKPDYWWNGTTIKELETQKVDLTEYAKKTDIPDISLNDDQATAGKYISKIEVDATDKHKLNITKADLPQGFSGKFGDLTEVPDEFTPSEHNHDDRYYTESEVDTKLGGKANATHNHTKSEITDFPTIPTIPDITVNNGSAESGKYISQVAVDETDKHKLIVTKADLPQGFSGDFGDLTNVPDEFTPSEHNHDDRYYTESEVDTKLGGKANATHNHTKSEITDFPTTMTPTAHNHTKSEITDFPTSMPPSEHNHDGDYYKKNETYTKAEIDAMFDNLKPK